MNSEYEERMTSSTGTTNERDVAAPITKHWPSMNHAPCSLGRAMFARTIMWTAAPVGAGTRASAVPTLSG
jgi:hypothetical protein